MDESRITEFKEKLDGFYAWPALYTFKFIVKAGKEEEVRLLFPLHQDTSRTSRTGTYTSMTFQMMMPSSDAEIEVYKKAAAIEGLIAL